MSESKFGTTIKGHAKMNNHPGAETAKAIIRSNVLAAIGASQAYVFDAFAPAMASCGAAGGAKPPCAMQARHECVVDAGLRRPALARVLAQP